MYYRLRFSILHKRAAAVLLGGKVALLSSTSSTRLDSNSIPPADRWSSPPCTNNETFIKSPYFTPQNPYPEWDYNWDNSNDSTNISNGKIKTRHILLIRHGQYEQGSPNDKDQVLTKLGRMQAMRTGQRLADLISSNLQSDQDVGKQVTSYAGPCLIKTIHVSGMTRAKETAEIIAHGLNLISEDIVAISPDPLLNEGLPAQIIPKRPDVGTPEEQLQEIAESRDRIEAAFQKYFHRSKQSIIDNHMDHEFELMVCHANVIRYFLMRALQLPPEAWLRLSLFNCSITYLVIQPNGYVTARLIGDTGHIPYNETTFSGSFGYNWAGPSTASQ